MNETSNPIRLVANVRGLDPHRRSGLAGAFRLLFDPLLDMPASGVEVTLLVSPAARGGFAAWRPDLRTLEVGEEAPDEQIAAAIEGFDVLFCPFPSLDPATPPIPAIVVVPDLLHLAKPELFPREVLAERLRRVRPSATRARTVLTFSRAGRDQVASAFHLPEERIQALELDCDPVFRAGRDESALAALRAEFDLPERWILFAGADRPLSNHRTLFRALGRLHRRHAAMPPLVLAGERGCGVDLAEEARAAGVEDLVRDLGWLPLDRMPALYDGAACAVSPALLPGLGLQFVEAMRRSTPLVAAHLEGVAEVTGDTAVLVDPLDEGALAEAVVHILINAPAARERAARARQLVEARSNRRAAEQLTAIVRAAAERPTPVLLLSSARSRPKVFVVTPSLNQARFLRATIDSVLAQDYPSIDYLVADGGSTDGSVEILRSYGDRIRWTSAPDAGQAAAVTEAWQRSDADLLAWINSDDTFLPGAISRAVDHLLARPEASMVYGRAWHVDEQGNRLRRYPTVEFDPLLLRDECFVCQPATLLRADVFRLIDYPDPSLHYCMDYDLWIRLAKHFGVSYLEEYLACSRIHSDTKSLRDRRKVYEEIIDVARRRFGSVSRNWSVGSIIHRSQRSASRYFGFLPESARTRIQAAIACRLERRIVGPLYPDRWAGSASMVEVFPDRDRRARLRAESPFWPSGEGPVVTVEAAGRVLARADVRSRGPFVLEFTLPDQVAVENGAANVLLRSSETFVPKVSGWAEWDERPISVLVRDRPGERPRMSMPVAS